MTDYLARAETDINAKPERVWTALTDPELVKLYMMGSTIETDWKVGSPILWKDEWEGKPFEDRGEVVAINEPRSLTVTHFSPMSGQEDRPENYHTLTYELSEIDAGTRIVLTQDNNATSDQADQFSENWAGVLLGLKRIAERP